MTGAGIREARGWGKYEDHRGSWLAQGQGLPSRTEEVVWGERNAKR